MYDIRIPSARRAYPVPFLMDNEASRGPGCAGVLLCTSKQHGPKGNEIPVLGDEVRRKKRPAGSPHYVAQSVMSSCLTSMIEQGIFRMILSMTFPVK